MKYFDVDEELQEFAETRERDIDEARFAGQPDAFLEMLYNPERPLSDERTFTPVRVEKVVLLGEKESTRSIPTDYPEGFARLIVRAPTGQERPVEVRWDCQMMYPFDVRFMDSPVSSGVWV